MSMSKVTLITIHAENKKSHGIIFASRGFTCIYTSLAFSRHLTDFLPFHLSTHFTPFRYHTVQPDPSHPTIRFLITLIPPLPSSSLFPFSFPLVFSSSFPSLAFVRDVYVERFFR